MDTTAPPVESVGPTPTLSLLERVAAVYTRPAKAWIGLKERAQWWFPMLIVLVIATGLAVALYQRAIVPDQMEQWDRQVSSGQMPPEQADKMEQFFSGPVGMATSLGIQFVFIAGSFFVIALLVWFAVGFVLGTKFPYRLALEVVSWSALIGIPGQLIASTIAWYKGGMRGVHTGFGVLLPEAESPSKLQTALGSILDGLGPLSIWYMTVIILGATALSGAPRKSVAWTLGTLYVVLVVIFSALGAALTPSA